MVGEGAVIVLPAPGASAGRSARGAVRVAREFDPLDVDEYRADSSDEEESTRRQRAGRRGAVLRSSGEDDEVAPAEGAGRGGEGGELSPSVRRGLEGVFAPIEGGEGGAPPAAAVVVAPLPAPPAVVGGGGGGGEGSVAMDVELQPGASAGPAAAAEGAGEAVPTVPEAPAAGERKAEAEGPVMLQVLQQKVEKYQYAATYPGSKQYSVDNVGTPELVCLPADTAVRAEAGVHRHGFCPHGAVCVRRRRCPSSELRSALWLTPRSFRRRRRRTRRPRAAALRRWPWRRLRVCQLRCVSVFPQRRANTLHHSQRDL